ncbi:DUF6517 family protein [Halopiger xanaduensis]|uniref:Lipoprotein n=1 Tax=Halopiger xanaduensis (strain DSM 18323 / JCM 14033 / SH-6) TaxID=797210 RepID=F8DCV3_HALXS|nr:DUF6517 family protein [Halopiger xanaduensis]AEH37282.1 hypothetical protein Halxa_2665 [Halopiger xanaduensis SH-6]
MQRRSFIAGLGIGGLAALSGCLGVIGMDEHTSTPAGVDPGVREDAGYEAPTLEELVVERAVGTDAYSETITVTNHQTQYEKVVDMGPLGEQRGAVFSVLSTPQIELAGRQFNPVEEMSTTELVELIASNYEGIGNVTLEEEAAIQVLDQATTRSRFTADAEFEGRSVEVDLHVTEAVETDSDLLVTVGVYPQRLRSQEEDDVLALMEGVTETLEEDASTPNDGDAESGEGDGENNESDGSGGNETQDGNESGDGNSGADNDSDDGGLFGE